MPSRTRITPFAALAVAALSLSACNDADSSPPPVTLTRLEVGPAAAGGVVASVAAPVQFTATGSYSDGTSADLTTAVTWSSSNVGAATFSSGAGLATPVAVGSTEVTATHAASGLHSSVSLSIVAADLVLLEISPLDPTILIGKSLQLEATGTLLDESTIGMTTEVLWTSSDEAVATVSPGGLAAALSLGSTLITATDPVTGISDTINFGVTDVPAALAYLRLSRGSVIGGSSTPITGTVVLTSSAVEPITVTLSTSNADLVTVPELVIVPAGAATASFDVTTSAVLHKTRVLVTASDGTYEKGARLNLRADKH
jgi:trimeric autotransporter adhesin